MTVRLDADGIIHLDAVCGIEDAEALLRHLLAVPAPRVDWRSCTQAHTAVIQLLLVARPCMDGPPKDSFLARHVAPLLGTAASG